MAAFRYNTRGGPEGERVNLLLARDQRAAAHLQGADRLMVNEKPFKLDMPFEEALRRFAQTDEKELPERDQAEAQKKAGGRSPPAKREAVRRNGVAWTSYFSVAAADGDLTRSIRWHRMQKCPSRRAFRGSPDQRRSLGGTGRNDQCHTRAAKSQRRPDTQLGIRSLAGSLSRRASLNRIIPPFPCQTGHYSICSPLMPIPPVNGCCPN